MYQNVGIDRGELALLLGREEESREMATSR